MAVCRVCSHLERDTINALLIDKSISIREIAKRYGMGSTSLRRHRDEHLPSAASMKARDTALEKKKQEIFTQSARTSGAPDNQRREPATNDQEFLQIGWYKTILQDFHTKIEVIYNLAITGDKPKLYAANGTMTNLLAFLKLIGDHLGFTKEKAQTEINIQAQKVELINSQFKRIMEIIKEYPEVEQRVIAALLEGE